MKKVFLLSIIALLMLSTAGFAYAQTSKEVDFNNSLGSATVSRSDLTVQVMNYSPYPVSAGEWFDLWLKVENMGQGDAKDVRLELLPSYPFESNDSLVRDYATIPGTVSAFPYGKNGEATWVMLKYRVRAQDNSPEGISNLQFKITENSNSANSPSTETDLPIEIGKTRTDFDVIMQDSTSTGTSFAIANTGSNDATAVTVTLEDAPVTGARSSILGNLAAGDFTTVMFQLVQSRNLQEVPIKIDYTDISGVRTSVEKTVAVNFASSGNFTASAKARTASSGSNLSNYIYLLVGLIVGAVGLQLYKRIRARAKK